MISNNHPSSPLHPPLFLTGSTPAANEGAVERLSRSQAIFSASASSLQFTPSNTAATIAASGHSSSLSATPSSRKTSPSSSQQPSARAVPAGPRPDRSASLLVSSQLATEALNRRSRSQSIQVQDEHVRSKPSLEISRARSASDSLGDSLSNPPSVGNTSLNFSRPVTLHPRPVSIAAPPPLPIKSRSRSLSLVNPTRVGVGISKKGVRSATGDAEYFPDSKDARSASTDSLAELAALIQLHENSFQHILTSPKTTDTVSGTFSAPGSIPPSPSLSSSCSASTSNMSDYIVPTNPPPPRRTGGNNGSALYAAGEEVLNDDDLDFLDGPPKRRNMRPTPGSRPQARDDMEGGRADTSDLASFLRESVPNGPVGNNPRSRTLSQSDSFDFLKDEPKKKGFFSKARDAMTGGLTKKPSQASLRERPDSALSSHTTSASGHGAMSPSSKRKSAKELEFDAQLSNTELIKVILPNGNSYYTTSQGAVSSAPKPTHKATRSTSRSQTHAAGLPSESSVGSPTGPLVENSPHSAAARNGVTGFNDPFDGGRDIPPATGADAQKGAIPSRSGSLSSVQSFSISDIRKQAQVAWVPISANEKHLPDPLQTENLSRGPSSTTTPASATSSFTHGLRGQQRSTSDLLKDFEKQQPPLRSSPSATKISNAAQPAEVHRQYPVADAAPPVPSAPFTRAPVSSSAAPTNTSSAANSGTSEPSGLPAPLMAAAVSGTASPRRPPREPAPRLDASGGRVTSGSSADHSTLAGNTPNKRKPVPAVDTEKANTADSLVDAKTEPPTPSSATSNKPPEPQRPVRPDSSKEDLLAAIANAPKNYSQLSVYSSKNDLWRALEATRAAAILAENRSSARVARHQRMARKTVQVLETTLNAHSISRRPSSNSMRSHRSQGDNEARIRKHLGEVKQSLKPKTFRKEQKASEYTPEREMRPDDASELVSDDFSVTSADKSPALGSGAFVDSSGGGTARAKTGTGSNSSYHPPALAPAITNVQPTGLVGASSSNKNQATRQPPAESAGLSASTTPTANGFPSSSSANTITRGTYRVPSAGSVAPIAVTADAFPTPPTMVPSPSRKSHQPTASTASESDNHFTAKASMQISEQDAQIFARYAAASSSSSTAF